MRRLLALIATAALAGTLATAATALSEPAYVKAASKICAQRQAKLKRLPAVSPKRATAKQIAAKLRRVIPIYSAGTRQLRALKPPHAFSFLVPRWLRYEQKRITTWRAALNVAAHGKRKAAQRYIKKSDVLGLRAAEISTGLEIDNCE
jgi:hypothetical protein